MFRNYFTIVTKKEKEVGCGNKKLNRTLESEKKQLFSANRGFRCEKQKPRNLVAYVNEYYVNKSLLNT